MLTRDIEEQNRFRESFDEKKIDFVKGNFLLNQLRRHTSKKILN